MVVSVNCHGTLIALLFPFKLDALLRVPRQSLYWEALAILQLSLNDLHLKSCEIQSNRYAQAILPSIALVTHAL